jgi:hypothetical protein
MMSGTLHGVDAPGRARGAAAERRLLGIGSSARLGETHEICHFWRRKPLVLLRHIFENCVFTQSGAWLGPYAAVPLTHGKALSCVSELSQPRREEECLCMHATQPQRLAQRGCDRSCGRGRLVSPCAAAPPQPRRSVDCTTGNGHVPHA